MSASIDVTLTNVNSPESYRNYLLPQCAMQPVWRPSLEDKERAMQLLSDASNLLNGAGFIGHRSLFFNGHQEYSKKGFGSEFGDFLDFVEKYLSDTSSSKEVYNFIQELRQLNNLQDSAQAASASDALSSYSSEDTLRLNC